MTARSMLIDNGSGYSTFISLTVQWRAML